LKSPAEYFGFRWRFSFPADLLNFLQVFWISSGIGFARQEKPECGKKGESAICIGPIPLRDDPS